MYNSKEEKTSFFENMFKFVELNLKKIVQYGRS
jgi:hypothetical protein